MAVHYLVSPVDGRVKSLIQQAPRKIVVRGLPHNLDRVADSIRNAWFPELGSKAFVKWATPASSSAFIASVYIPGTAKPVATLVIEEMEQ